MENKLQMIEFDWWLCLTVAIFLLVSGIVGIVDDIRHKRNWFFWLLHILSIILGAIFTNWTL